MKNLIILFCIIAGGFSQINNIDSLVMVNFDGFWFAGQKLNFKCIIYFNKDIAVVINKPYKNDFMDLIITPIDKDNTDKYLIRYDPGPSVDPAYEIYQVVDKDTIKIGVIPGNEISIPGDNFIYGIMRVNRMFNRRKKYSIADNKLIEIKQPYYYVGLNSVTSKDISIYKDTLFLEPVAALAEGESVFVLLNLNDNYLIKSSNDMTGWIKIPLGDGGTIIFDIFKAGD